MITDGCIYLLCNTVYVQRMSKVPLSCTEEELDDRRYFQPPFHLTIAARTPPFSPGSQELGILFFFIMCIQISVNVQKTVFNQSAHACSEYGTHFSYQKSSNFFYTYLKQKKSISHPTFNRA